MHKQARCQAASECLNLICKICSLRSDLFDSVVTSGNSSCLPRTGTRGTMGKAVMNISVQVHIGYKKRATSCY